MSAAVYSFNDIRMRFGKRTILAIEELQLHRGHCIALSGRNGAGKTTLLKVIAGLLRPQHATVQREGAAQPWNKARGALRRDIVYMHQFPYMFDASVTENIAYGLHAQHVPAETIRARVAQALALMGIAHLADANAKSLSGGERQRTALARAWVLQPKVLLLDEPTASMDRESREQTWFILRRLKAEDLSIVITSHDEQSLTTLPDRHLHLDAGRLAPPGGNSAPAGGPSLANGSVHVLSQEWRP